MVQIQVLPFMRSLFCLFLTSTLAFPCLALEGIGQISVSFSVWSSPLIDLDLVEDVVLDALQDFFCHDTSLILIDKNVRNMCYQRGIEGETNIFANMATWSILDFIHQTDSLRSYLEAETTNVLISDSYNVTDAIEGTTWDVEYEVVQVGSMEMEKARASNTTDNIIFMENRIQQRLDASIADGSMRQRMRGTGIIIGEFGDKWESYSENPITFEEENVNADPELDYKQAAVILRYIGIVILIGSFSFTIALSILGRRYRKQRESGEKSATRRAAEQRGLVTEQGVNIMLDIGRRESERISSVDLGVC
mmetsp:Transcript_26945/g.74064  ORF Transcript_26945/g.74064 Transcript_26945/m.74064 type:complete len:308 (+) Transcript_26945:245-1168(+)